MERRKFLIMGKKDRDSGLSIRQWGIAALLLGLIVILGILVCSTDYAVRKLEQESAAQYLSILDMRRLLWTKIWITLPPPWFPTIYPVPT